jgi:N-acetyl-1-D-myo-inositol-2-amino-2-deoxy-alpha-D-glucopyranoside deacetylase
MKNKTSTPVLSFVFLIFISVFSGNTLVAKNKSPLLRAIHFAKTDRILALIPHPDDESLATAGVIRYSVEHKIPVLVVLMNNGDGYRKNVEMRFKTLNPTPEEFQKLGYVRHLESLSAMKELGLQEKDVIFLSYPDGGTNSLFDVNWDCDNLHTGVNGSTHAPYPFAYEKDAPYCGENVVKNLEEIITAFKPSTIFYPDPGDDHHDHWATGAFAKYTLLKMGYKGKQYTYLVHKGRSWPVPWAYLPNRYLPPPRSLVGFDEKWLGFFMTPGEEKLKLRAVEKYVSQSGMMEPFLQSFVRKNELFASYPILKIDTSKKQPRFFSEKSLPDTVFRDPKNDVLIKEFADSGDLTSVGLVFNKKNLWIALQTKGNISPDVVYGFHLRVFRKNSISRIDIKVQGGLIYSEKLAKNSIAFDSIIPFETDKDRIVVQLPVSVFKGQAGNFMLSLDTFDSKSMKRIDKTAWRIFEK